MDTPVQQQPVTQMAPKPQVPQPVAAPLVKKISTGKNTNIVLIVAALVVVIAGVGTGWLLSGKAKSSSGSALVPGSVNTQKEAGIADEKTFKDTAEGTLETGGISGEGTHHLVRDGGPSKYVYLISTVIDLESFKGKKVQVWGETSAGRKAGWLMDVGKIKVLD